MRLYLDQQYPASLVNIIRNVQALQYPQQYEVISGRWSEDNAAGNTIVFLIDTSKKGLDPHAINLYRDGFRVFAYRKPYDKPYNLFQQTLLLLGQWKKILSTIEKERSPFIYTIGERKKPLEKYELQL